MKRAYFVADTLDEIELVEKDLEEKGFTETQLQVLSEDEVGVQDHHLHSVPSFYQKDVVHQGIRGALLGIFLAGSMLTTAHLLGAYQYAGATPFVFLAVVILGFSTWTGGFIGIQQTNYKFRELKKVVAKGRHVFLIDFTKDQESVIKKLASKHPRLASAGFGSNIVNPFEDAESNVTNLHNYSKRAA